MSEIGRQGTELRSDGKTSEVGIEKEKKGACHHR